jgi:hypothetical protein
VLLILLAVAVFFGMSGEGFDRLWEAHLLKEIGLPPLAGMEPVVWFGLINAGTLVLGYLATEVLGHYLDVSNVAVAARLLFVLNALTVAGVLAFALAGSFALALGAFWFASLTRKLFYPLYLTWINRGHEPGVRATVISISNGGELAGGAGRRTRRRSYRYPREHPRSPGDRRDRALSRPPALRKAVRHGGVDPSLDARNDTGKSNYRY